MGARTVAPRLVALAAAGFLLVALSGCGDDDRAVDDPLDDEPDVAELDEPDEPDDGDRASGLPEDAAPGLYLPLDEDADVAGQGACGLLEPGEVEAFAGSGADAAIQHGPDAAMVHSHCLWTGDGDRSLAVGVFESAQRYHARLEVLADDDEGRWPEPQPVDGIGEEAFLLELADGAGLQLTVRTGERVVEVQAGPAADHDLDALADLARTVLERI